MATTIKSTSLDFESIKNNLKTFLADKDEFSDYNFEASGLSNILDVLAYNTHYNGLIANFALNESFLNTAQLRSSVVSLAEGIGYVPDSKSSSQALVNLTMNLSGVSNRPASISIPSGFKFTSTVDDTEYTFQTQEIINATDDGSGNYEFSGADGLTDIKIFEGTEKTKTFFITQATEDAVYIIPDVNLDSKRTIVRVYESPTSSSFSTYIDILDATTINRNSTLYILKEAPNGFFELSFGDGNTLGTAPSAGQKAVVTYLSVSGATADNASVFSPSAQVSTSAGNFDITVSTVSKSAGGSDKETIDSIRKNAPFQYASQNRMVTAEDYSSLVLRNFSSLIDDIKSWGGQDNLEPQFGAVYISVLYKDGISAAIQATNKQEIRDLAEQFSVASFSLEFADPIRTFTEVDVFFRFNQNLTTLSENTIQSEVKEVINKYFAASTGRFGRAFRRSNLLTLVDAVSPAVLSSRAEIKMQQRLLPTLTLAQDYSNRYPQTIANPDDVNHIITSSSFTFNGNRVEIRNRLSSRTLQLFAPDLGESGEVIIDNIGSYDNTTITINGLQVDAFIGANKYIRLSAVPANQSALVPVNQDIIDYDANISRAIVVKTSAEN